MWMAEAADRAAWNRTCAVLAQIYNLGRGEGDRPVDPMRFCPWDRKRPLPPPPSPEEVEMLKKLFPAKG